MQKNGGGFLTRIIKGLAIGVAAMLPGASGGVRFAANFQLPLGGMSEGLT